jgi:hypothetical protein
MSSQPQDPHDDEMQPCPPEFVPTGDIPLIVHCSHTLCNYLREKRQRKAQAS